MARQNTLAKDKDASAKPVTAESDVPVIRPSALKDNTIVTNITPLPEAVLPARKAAKATAKPLDIQTAAAKADKQNINEIKPSAKSNNAAPTLAAANNIKAVPAPVTQKQPAKLNAEATVMAKAMEKASTIKPAAGDKVQTNPKTEPLALKTVAPVAAPPKSEELVAAPLTPIVQPAKSPSIQPPKDIAKPEAMTVTPKEPTRAEKRKAEREAALKEKADSERASAIASMKKIQIWEGSEGSTLKSTLADWSKQSGVKVNWSAKNNPDLETDIFVSGTLENALKTVFTMGVKEAPQYTLDKEKPEITVTE